MRVKIISSDPEKDPLYCSDVIPKLFEQHFLSNAERAHFHASCYEYLEQCYLSTDCVMCFLNIEVHSDCTVQPFADVPMLVLVYMLFGSVPSELNGFGEVLLQQGFAYLLYLQMKAIHRSPLTKGHYRIAYCCISQSYLDNMAGEHPGIADLLALFNNGLPSGLIDKKAEIGFQALYQMWLVRECMESTAYCESNLKARGLDLVLDYVKQSNKQSMPSDNFIANVLPNGDKIFQAQKLIEDNPSGKLLIKAIAKQIGINEQDLKRGFRETFGMALGKYQTSSKVTQACKLLTGTNLSIAQITDRMGYADKSSLTRIFRKELKTTPSEYRLKGRKISQKPN